MSDQKMMAATLLNIYVLLQNYLFAHGIRCFECNDTPHPRLCDTVVTCSSSQSCVVQQYVTSDGLILYKSGCMANTRCKGPDLIGKREEITITKREDIITCIECCSNDFCNNKGCGQSELPKDQRGLYCYSCASTLDPKSCNKVSVCSSEQTCLIKLNTAFLDQNNPVYTQSCSPKSCSDSVASPCQPSCCNTDFCNDNFDCITTPGPWTTTPTSTKHDVTSKQPVQISTTISKQLTTAVHNAVVEAECRKHINDGFWYDPVTSTCIQVNKLSSSINHYQAQQRCIHENATLVSITSQYVQERILVWIFSHQLNDTNFWIGAKTHRNGSHIYYWPGGENVVYSQWGGALAGQPDDRRLGNQNCVFLNNRDRYFWHDDRCSELKTGFICEIWNVTSGQKHSKCISKVFEGYTYDPFNDFCVKLHFDDHIHHYTQAMAKDACKKDGASLVTLDNESKMDYILQNIFSNRQNATDYWIGAEDIHNNSEFYWSTGQKIAYSHWGGPAWADNLTQPDELYGAINRRCVYLNHEHNYTWFDRDCSSHLTGYICQYFGNNSGEVSLTDCTSRLSKGYSYDSSSNFCISIHKGENVTRSQARQRCSMDKSTDLVVIDNNQKMDYISKLLGDSAADFWIGGLDTFHNATFYWEPVNKVFNYTNWFTGIQPLPSDCAFLDYQNKYFWSTTSCSRPINGYICQISEKSIKSPACDTSGGYKNIAANENYVMCVKLHTESVHRSEAQQICAGEGAVLISLDTDEKLHQLRYFLSQNNSTRHQSLVIWTGGRRNGTNFYYPNGVISPLPLFCAKHLGTCECTYTSISKQLNMHAHTIKCNNSKSHSFMCERTFAHGAMA